MDDRDTTGGSRYRWPRAVVLRSVGVGLVWLGLTWVVGVLVSPLVGLGSVAAVIAAAVTAVVVVAAVWLVARPPVVLDLSDDGYHVRRLRGAGVPQARWRDVTSAQLGDTASGPALLIALKDGRRTVVPLLLLGTRTNEAARDAHDRLDAAYGYRPLDPPSDAGAGAGPE